MLSIKTVPAKPGDDAFNRLHCISGGLIQL